MPNKTLSQFVEQTEPDVNDFAVGYGPNPSGTLVEKRYSLPTLGSQILPYSGLSTGTFQIRAFAETTYDTYGAAAITTKEEVISWGLNTNKAKWGNSAAAWAGTLVKQTPSKPAIIPFFNGTPRDPSDSANLKDSNLTITKLIDSRSHTMALLSNGSVWLKCAVADAAALGYAQGFGAFTGTARTLTGFFRIPAAYFESSINGSAVAIKDIGMLPETSPDVARAVYWAIDVNDDLHIWGSFGSGASGIYTANLYEPKNIGPDSPSQNLLRNVKDCRIVGAARNHTIFVLTKDGKIFAQGYNTTGLAGTGAKTALTGWTQCKKLDNPTDGGSGVLITDAESLAFSTYNHHNFGYISKPVNGINSIFISGENGSVNNIQPNFLRNATPNNSTNWFFVKSPGAMVSEQNNPFVELHIDGTTGRSTAYALSLNGTVYSAGANNVGQGGRVASGNVLSLGPEFNKVGWRITSLQAAGSTTGTYFGGSSRFKAIKIIVDRTSTTNPCTAIIAYDSTRKRNQIFFAGYRTYANGGGAFSESDSVFRPLAFVDSALDCLILSDSTSHQTTLVLSENLRTYGLGYSNAGLLSETDGYSVLPQLIF